MNSTASTRGAGTCMISVPSHSRAELLVSSRWRNRRRGTGWNTCSPQRSASSTRARSSGSAGNSGGSGRTSSRKRAIRRVPWSLRPSSSSAGTVKSSKPAKRTSSG